MPVARYEYDAPEIPTGEYELDGYAKVQVEELAEIPVITIDRRMFTPTALREAARLFCSIADAAEGVREGEAP